MVDDIVLSFQDSLLRKSDVELLQEGQWLNDKIIGFMFQYFEYERFRDLDDVLFVNPDVAQYIKLCKGTELFTFLEPLELHSKKTIFLPVNDSVNLESKGGTHWSLLVYDKRIQKFEHYDSLTMFNHSQALRMKLNIETFLKAAQKEVVLLEVPCPQQTNSYDCGMYVISMTEHLCMEQQNGLKKSLDDQVSSISVKRKRKEIKELIDQLRDEK